MVLDAQYQRQIADRKRDIITRCEHIHQQHFAAKGVAVRHDRFTLIVPT
jgi:hypothetical protein